jgi:hypothetical protein
VSWTRLVGTPPLRVHTVWGEKTHTHNQKQTQQQWGARSRKARVSRACRWLPWAGAATVPLAELPRRGCPFHDGVAQVAAAAAGGGCPAGVAHARLPPQCHDTAPHHTNITGRPESDKATKRERGKERERGREGRGREGEGEPQHRAGWRTWVGSETGMEPGELCPFSAMGCTCCMGGAVPACARTQRVNCQIVDTALVVSGRRHSNPTCLLRPPPTDPRWIVPVHPGA